MLYSVQIRAARALLDWSAADLARESDVSHQAIHRAERAVGVPNMHVNNMKAIRTALEAAGVIFVEENGEGPGVRLRKSTSS